MKAKKKTVQERLGRLEKVVSQISITNLLIQKELKEIKDGKKEE